MSLPVDNTWFHEHKSWWKEYFDLICNLNFIPGQSELKNSMWEKRGGKEVTFLERTKLYHKANEEMLILAGQILKENSYG